MQLIKFSVTGYKNFQKEIVLENMGKICVIHGENNVGKSNLLEAMQLFFKCCYKWFSSSDSDNKKLNLSADELAKLGFKTSEIFNLALTKPILITANLISEPEKQKTISIRLTLTKLENNDISCTISTLEKNIFSFKNLFMPYQESAYVLIGVDRLISESEMETGRNIVPQTLLLKLYDIKDSLEPSIYEKWALFVRTLQRFNDVLGKGEFVALFNRHSNRANLAFQPQKSNSRRIPIEMLGSGIQQVVALIARLLVSNATIIGIEEPELNLRYTLQLRLREIFTEIVEDPVGPKQIIISSHSPAFEFGKHFYAMRTGKDAPTLTHRPIAEANYFTEHYSNTAAIDETAPMGYVSSDGLVKLPEYVRQTLQIEQGGGVVFIKRQDNGHIEILTNDQYFDLLEMPRKTEK